MQNSNEEQELGKLGEFLALTAVTIVFIGGILLFAYFSKDSDSNTNFGTCETRFDSSACPSPDDQDDSEYIENLPEASQFDEHPDNCGGYSCKQLEKEANEEIEQTDKEIQEELRKRGLE